MNHKISKISVAVVLILGMALALPSITQAVNRNDITAPVLYLLLDDSDEVDSISIDHIKEFNVIGEPNIYNEIRLVLDSNLSSDEVETKCFSGSTLIPLSVNASYTIQAADNGNYIQCFLSSLNGGFSISTPFLGPIKNRNIAKTDESITTKILHTIPAGQFNETTKPVRILNSTVTHKGETYFVYVDNNLYPIIGKVDREDNITLARLDPDDNYKVFEEGHHQFSIGIDRLGYIHVAGDMHSYTGLSKTLDEKFLAKKYQGQRMMLWRSTHPENINSFEFAGQNNDQAPSGSGFTYANFVSGMNGELFLRARMSLTQGGWYPGKRGWGLYRYNASTQSPFWKDIHGKVVSPIFGEGVTPYTTFIWEDNGYNNSGYQGFAAGMKFDANNVIHVASTINNDNAAHQATHLIYAKSEDLGETWKKATGKKIAALPLRVDPVQGQADIVIKYTDIPTFTHGLYSRAFLANKQNGDPCILYSGFSAPEVYQTQRYQCFNRGTGSWSVPLVEPTRGIAGTHVMEDINGLSLFIQNSGQGHVHRSFNFSNGYNLFLPGRKQQFLGLDVRSIYENNEYIGFVKNRLTKDLELTSLKFTPNENLKKPLPDVWGERLYSGSTGESFVLNSVVNLNGTGREPAYDTKEMQYIYQNIAGDDFDVRMRVRNLDTKDQTAFVGFMMSENLESDSKFLSFYIKHGMGIVSAHNYSDSLKKNVLQTNVFMSEWLRLKKVGNSVYAYRSDNGKKWDLLRKIKIQGSRINYVGLIKGATDTQNLSRIDSIQLSRF